VPPRPGLTWSTLVNLLELAIERQDVAEAETYLAQATAFHRKHHKPGGTAALVLLHRRARLHRLKGELDQARRLIGEARALRPSDEVAWGILTDEGEISEALGDPQAAIQAYQAAIGVLDGVHDAMGTSELQLWSLAKKRRPFARLFALYARRGDAAKAFRVWNRYQRRAATERLLTSSVPPGESVAEVSQAARDRLELVSRAAKPLRAAHALPEGDATPDRRLQGLDGLFYFEAVDDVYVITVRRGALAVRALGRRPDELAAQAAAFVARPEDAQLASQLGALLFPAGSLPLRDGLVYLSPSPGLAEVPFGALRVGGKAVVERVALALIPGLAAFERPLRRPGGPALIVADPLGDLPAARAEAIDLAGRIGAPATPFLGSMASKDLLRAGASPLIHLATHSGLGPTGPWLQFHDGRLQTGDILNGSFRPHTVVLPTCASAVGRGPGITPSLGAAFLAAGAESVVGSLRSLDDQVSRRFMRAFYEQGGAEDPARAVAQVQRRWLRDRPVGEWAPFVVLGRSAVTNPGGGRPMASRSPLAGEHR
jgi:hypothetical protein